MSVLLVSTATPNMENAELIQEYTSKAGPLLVAAGGKPVKKAKLTKPLVGNPDYAMSVIFEFPNTEAIEGVFNSEEYKALIPVREKAFKNLVISIAEEA